MEQKTEGDLESVKLWNEHQMETHIMHLKLDALAFNIGHPFLLQKSTSNMRNMAGEGLASRVGPSIGSIIRAPDTHHATQGMSSLSLNPINLG